VITVGATDTNGTVSQPTTCGAVVGVGVTNDGFTKPEIAAPGRYMYGPVPSGSALPGLLPDRVVSPVHVDVGTSFSAPVVSAAAAYVLAQHPTWTPDR